MKLTCSYTKERYRGTSVFYVDFPWGEEVIWSGFLDKKLLIDDPLSGQWQFNNIYAHNMCFKYCPSRRAEIEAVVRDVVRKRKEREQRKRRKPKRLP